MIWYLKVICFSFFQVKCLLMTKTIWCIIFIWLVSVGVDIVIGELLDIHTLQQVKWILVVLHWMMQLSWQWMLFLLSRVQLVFKKFILYSWLMVLVIQCTTSITHIKMIMVKSEMELKVCGQVGVKVPLFSLTQKLVQKL